jgi:predicted acetyltransferase
VTPRLRRATSDDLPDMAVVDGRAFGVPQTPADLEDFRPLFDPDRYLLACDPDDASIVGVTGSYLFDVTLPGGAALPVPGVTWVSVAATHRRRGILRALLTVQHRELAETGAALAVLTASEGGIYGRFGYGTATVHRSVRIERRRAEFRADAPDPGGVRMVDGEEIRKLAPPIHRRWASITPGAVWRTDAWWDRLLLDRERHRQGSSPLFHLAHPDGYASYRIRRDDDSCVVAEVVAATEEAHAALWRILLALDLTETVHAWSRPAEDPLPDLLTDPRQVRTTGLADGMWARPLDVPAALAARRYAVEIDCVLDVRDPFLDLGGRFRLRGGPDGADCVRTDAAVDIGTDMATLGGLLFGGRRATTLARAGLLVTDDPALLSRFDRALLADRSPQHGTEF